MMYRNTRSHRGDSRLAGRGSEGIAAVWSSLQLIHAAAIIQIIVLAVAYYYIFLFFRGTRGAQVLVGFALVLAILIGLTNIFNLEALNWLLRGFRSSLALLYSSFFSRRFGARWPSLAGSPCLPCHPENERSSIISFRR